MCPYFSKRLSDLESLQPRQASRIQVRTDRAAESAFSAPVSSISDNTFLEEVKFADLDYR
jgi:hypothetical protein